MRPGIFAIIDRACDRLAWKALKLLGGPPPHAAERAVFLFAVGWGWWIHYHGWTAANLMPFEAVYDLWPGLPPIVGAIGLIGLLSRALTMGAFGVKATLPVWCRVREYTLHVLALAFFALSLSTALTHVSSTAVPVYLIIAHMAAVESVRLRMMRDDVSGFFLRLKAKIVRLGEHEWNYG